MKKNIYEKYFKKRLNYIIPLLFIIIFGVIMESVNPYLFGKIIDKIGEKDRIAVEKNLIYFSIILLSIQILSCFEKIIGKIVVSKIVNVVLCQDLVQVKMRFSSS